MALAGYVSISKCTIELPGISSAVREVRVMGTERVSDEEKTLARREKERNRRRKTEKKHVCVRG